MLNQKQLVIPINFLLNMNDASFPMLRARNGNNYFIHLFVGQPIILNDHYMHRTAQNFVS